MKKHTRWSKRNIFEGCRPTFEKFCKDLGSVDQIYVKERVEYRHRLTLLRVMWFFNV